MSRFIRRLILAPLAAASLLMTAAGVALADPESSVSVFNADGTPAAATVCEFYFEFNSVPGGESGSWELRSGGGAAVASGSYTVTDSAADREPDAGSLTFPNGTYTLLWDNEDVIDNSNEQLTIVIECATDTPVPSQSVAADTDAPTQSIAGDTDAPTQSIAGDTDAPDRTLPDTTGPGEPARPDPNAWTGLLVVLIGLAAFVFALTPHRRPGRR